MHPSVYNFYANDLSSRHSAGSIIRLVMPFLKSTSLRAVALNQAAVISRHSSLLISLLLCYMSMSVLLFVMFVLNSPINTVMRMMIS